MPVTDTLKQTISDHLEAIRPSLDACRPVAVRIAVWLLPDGTIREIETAPTYKASGGKR